jgi:hypothetical protein
VNPMTEPILIAFCLIMILVVLRLGNRRLQRGKRAKSNLVSTKVPVVEKRDFVDFNATTGAVGFAAQWRRKWHEHQETHRD